MRGWAPRDRSYARRERGDEWGFRAECARGLGGGRSNAYSGPVPLRLTGLWVGSSGIGPAFAGNVGMG